MLIKTLQWHILPEDRQIGYLPLEQTTERERPMKIVLVGATSSSKKNSIVIEFYCFETRKWTALVHIQLPDARIERHFAINGEDVFIVNGNEQEFGPVVTSSTVSA